MVMRTFLFACLAMLLPPSEAVACRGFDPSDLHGRAATGIALARITAVRDQPDALRQWEAETVLLARLNGVVPKEVRAFADKGPGACGPSRPEPGTEWVLYFQSINGVERITGAWPFWFARRSDDPRLKRLDVLRPLGTARAPTHAEEGIIALFEAMAKEKAGRRDFHRYTRVYSLTSPQGFAVEFVPSRTPRRLYVDPREAGPTNSSCKCKVTTLFVGAAELAAKISELRAMSPGSR